MSDPDPPSHAQPAVLALLRPHELLTAAAVAVGDGHLDEAGLAAITGCARHDLDACLVMLTAVGVLRRTPDGRLIAAHALVRDGLLAALPPGSEPDLRRRVASALWT